MKYEEVVPLDKHLVVPRAPRDGYATCHIGKPLKPVSSWFRKCD
jgi:hypothetical protein